MWSDSLDGTVPVCCPTVYMVLRVVLVRLHGGSLHPHQPLGQTDEEWSLPVDSEAAQPGEPCFAWTTTPATCKCGLQVSAPL